MSGFRVSLNGHDLSPSNIYAVEVYDAGDACEICPECDECCCQCDDDCTCCCG